MNAAWLNSATPVAVGEADETGGVDIDGVATRLGRPAPGLG
jgi:hypothetical protein